MAPLAERCKETPLKTKAKVKHPKKNFNEVFDVLQHTLGLNLAVRHSLSCPLGFTVGQPVELTDSSLPGPTALVGGDTRRERLIKSYAFHLQCISCTEHTTKDPLFLFNIPPSL